ncbi:NUC185 domain-containing protein, partial [Blastocladiella britannica]
DCLESTDLLSASEKSDVHVFVERAVSRLRPEDRHLPQLQRMREMLRRGIAVHHSGVLPLVKEMVEILFGRGLVKVLFATETFAMGVNMPTKCVVFASIRKHDGIEFRNLLPGEYTQMSGRAGRRGLDETGTVLMMLTDLPDQESLKTMLLGAPTKLASQFRLTYNMIVNLLRVETLKVEEMMKRSFSENASQKMVPAAEREYMATQRALDSQPPLACVLCTRDLDQLYDVSRQLHTVAASVSALAAAHPVGARAVATGRLVVVSSRHYTNALGVVLSRAKSADAAAAGAAVTVLVLVDRGHKHNTGDILATGTADAPPPLPHSHLMIPAADRADGRLVMVAARDLAVVLASTLPNVKLEAVAQRNKYETRVAVQLLREYAVANADALPEYSWSKIRDLDFAEKWLQKQQLEKRARQFQCLHCPDLAVHYHQIHKTRSLSDKLVALRRQLSAQNLELLPEYHQRMAVLEQLGYVDPRSRTVQLKGRVACEINSCDELLLTELILDNFFADLDVAETAAVISVFLFQEKAQADGDFASAMLSADAREAGADGELPEDKTDEPIADMGVPVSVENYLKSNLRYGLVDVVYEWARGMPFLQIMSMTEVLEGSIVRCIVRIEESCREIKDAARLVGDGALYQKMDAASIAVKRDIVFCGSLYI